MAVNAVLFLILLFFAGGLMGNRLRITVDHTRAEEREWNARYAAWRHVFDEACRDWAELQAHQPNTRELRKLREFRSLRDAAPKAFLEYETNIDNDTLRGLQSIAWQVKAVFGEEPPIVDLVIQELEGRGHFPELIMLPEWFTR